MPAGTGLGQSGGSGGMTPSELARLEYLEDNEYKVTYWASVSTDSGAVTKPTGSTIILDGFMSGVDALVETIVNGQPSGLSPVTAGGAYVTVSSFDAAGNYTLSGTPSATPVALLYIVTIPGDQYQNLDNTKVITAEPVFVRTDVQHYTTTSGTDTYTASLTPVLTSYIAGSSVTLNFGNTNTGASTININSLGAKSIITSDASALTGGELQGIMTLIYNGTSYQILGGLGSGGLTLGKAYALNAGASNLF
jgi:hypothetical protein